ncbi:uncharacterized protein LOC132563268 [Ylistrum balloti]|uniref:uncharacterized protein LOC132563268 n=1 Tax=Ylistrum balloti TaxID=509963 RepID=UPI002905E880|nr:uncharacterized protein LOC132563268 [Ylistrum balloti]
MSTVTKENYSGEVVGCDVGDITLQIHLPCDDGDDEETDDFPDDEPLLRGCDTSLCNGAQFSTEGHVVLQTSKNERGLARRQLSTPTNLSGGFGIRNGNTLPYVPRPPQIVRRQTLPSNLIPDLPVCPGEITMEDSVYEISKNSATQIDIRWTSPSNSNEISNLVYEIQLQKNDDCDWIKLSDRGIPILRVYTTETRFILDGTKRSFSEGKCKWRLRIRGVSKGHEVRNEGPWSEYITLNILDSSSHVRDGGTA